MDLWHLILIIFVETGLVVMPFLPGDSLLFAAGALAAVTGAINPILLIILLSLAAVLGDTLNYHIGKYIGPKVFVTNSRWINHQHLVNTQKFLQRMAKRRLFLHALSRLLVPLHHLWQVRAVYIIAIFKL